MASQPEELGGSKVSFPCVRRRSTARIIQKRVSTPVSLLPCSETPAVVELAGLGPPSLKAANCTVGSPESPAPLSQRVAALGKPLGHRQRRTALTADSTESMTQEIR